MLQLVAPKTFKVSSPVLTDLAGRDAAYVFIKGTFDLQGRLVSDDEQVPLMAGEVFAGEPDKTELLVPSDITLGKPGTDVLLNAVAWPSQDSAKRNTGEVSLQVGSLEKTIRVFGERIWEHSLWRTRISDPQPFESLPLKWENAFGGSDAVSPEKFEARNPVGRGFFSTEHRRVPEGSRLPNLEYPSALIASWTDLPQPAGFGPIACHWQPRLGYAGTYDEVWQKTRAPRLPKNFDARFFCAAPSDQIVAEHLVGGEEVAITGAHKNDTVHFSLPQWEHDVAYRFGDHTENKTGKVETVSIDLEKDRLVMVWATSFICDQRALKIKEVSIRSTAR